MANTSQQVDGLEEGEYWGLRYDRSAQRIHVVVRGFATEEKARQATEQFLELLEDHTVDIVADLELMTGYTSESRRLWQECFYSVKRQLVRMLVVGKDIPAMVRMGVTVAAAFSGIPVRFFTSHEELRRTLG